MQLEYVAVAPSIPWFRGTLHHEIVLEERAGYDGAPRANKLLPYRSIAQPEAPLCSGRSSAAVGNIPQPDALRFSLPQDS